MVIFSREKLKAELKNRLLTTKDVASILGVSRQRAAAIGKAGHLRPIFSSKQGSLYLKEEVEKFSGIPQLTLFKDLAKDDVYKLILNKNNIIFSGNAGCGKTTFIEKFNTEIQTQRVNIIDNEMEIPLTKKMLEGNEGLLYTLSGNDVKKIFTKLAKMVDKEILLNMIDFIVITNYNKFNIFPVDHTFKRFINTGDC